MNYKTVSKTQTGVGSGAVVKFNARDDMRALINAVVTGTATYDLEYSLNGTDYVPLAGMTGKTVTDDATLVFPVHSVRVNITAGAGSVKLIVLSNGGAS